MMTLGRRPGASTALLFWVGEDVELRDTAPPVRATVVAMQRCVPATVVHW
jgi:hypothetical protein